METKDNKEKDKSTLLTFDTKVADAQDNAVLVSNMDETTLLGMASSVGVNTATQVATQVATQGATKPISSSAAARAPSPTPTTFSHVSSMLLITQMRKLQYVSHRVLLTQHTQHI